MPHTPYMNRLFASTVLLLASLAHAQNLVPNPSFEEHTLCPDHDSQIDRATGWQANAWSPDYYNACDTNGIVGVPSNLIGYQFAASGVAYAGMVTYTDSTLLQDYSEYIGIFLMQPLIPGEVVYLSFKTVPTIQGNSTTTMKYLCKGIGMKFRMQPLDLQNPQPADNIAALHLDEVVSDTANWTLVHGSYVPDSAYQYLVIGNFFDPAHSQSELVNPGGSVAGAYTFVDDICVSYDSTAYHHVGLSEPVADPPLTFAPNPFSIDCQITFAHPVRGSTSLMIRDQAGRLVNIVALPIGASEWHLADRELANGAYTISLTTPTGASRPVVLVHVSP